MTTHPSRALISRNAFRNNVAVIREHTDSTIMAIVKADAYGHGIETITRWAWDEGITWFGVAQLHEALALREKFTEGRVLSWMYAPGADFRRALKANLDLSIGASWVREEIAQAARDTGIVARVHINIDTGMSRGGYSLEALAEELPLLRALQDEGIVEYTGLWTHLACADALDSSVTDQQLERFEHARAMIDGAGLPVEFCHVAASGGILWHPESHYNMVRPGILLYGLSPEPSVASGADLGLRPVMQLEADVMIARDVPSGVGISYGHTFVTEKPAHLGVLPIGYADGLPRQASNNVVVGIKDPQTGAVHEARNRGVICMDQFIVEGDAVQPGATAVLFGDAAAGYPPVEQWSDAARSINYEIVTQIGIRVPRVIVD